MTDRLYIRNAFGWDTDYIVKVATAQSISTDNMQGCSIAILKANEFGISIPNLFKIMGYFPVLNVFMGLTVLILGSPRYNPDQDMYWRIRGVCMIFLGPLLLVVDCIKHLWDLHIANEYCDLNPHSLKQFDGFHGHAFVNWSIVCEGPAEGG